MLTDINLKQTPLHAEHLGLKARMVPFGGWEMPLQYDGILAEYQHTRQKAALFDTSHMGEFIIEGDAKKCGLEYLVTQSVSDIPLKTCRYGVMCNEDGGAIDDLIIFRLDNDRWFVVVNAGTMEKDAGHIQRHLAGNAGFKNISSQTGKLDIQGPLARDILSPLVKGIDKLDYYAFDYFDVLGRKVLVSRTGYTGELGYEIFYPWDELKELWHALLERGAQPAGLGVRDVLRLEMGYCLYGHELSEEISPLEAGLERFICFEKDFIGKNVLAKEKQSAARRQSIGFISRSRRSPRAWHNIYLPETGEEIGVVTSGTFSPGLNCGVGLGLVKSNHYQLGQTVLFGDKDSKYEAGVARRPFYKKGSLKS